MKTYFEALDTDAPAAITPEEHHRIAQSLQLAALLALKDVGLLTVMQYREAEAALRNCCRAPLSSR